MRFGFVTCVQLGLECMQEVDRVGGHLDFVMTLQDDKAVRKSGRIWPDEFCHKHGARLWKVPTINDPAAVEIIKTSGVDWLFVIGWSQIAGPAVLHAPCKGVLGMHPTLLPTGRGRASIPWAIIKGLKETGVTLFQLDEGVDTGPIVSQERVPIRPDETATTLYRRVARAHRTLIARVWEDLVADRVTMRPQDETYATEWPGRRPEDGALTPEMSIADVDRLVRATTYPYPGAFYAEADRVLRVWRGRALRAGDTAPPGIPLRFADGEYVATDFGWEAANP